MVEALVGQEAERQYLWVAYVLPFRNLLVAFPFAHPAFQIHLQQPKRSLTHLVEKIILREGIIRKEVIIQVRGFQIDPELIGGGEYADDAHVINFDFEVLALGFLLLLGTHLIHHGPVGSAVGKGRLDELNLQIC